MEKLKKAFRIVLYILAIFIMLCSMLSIFRNSEIRYLKMLDFPRIQLFIISLATILILLIFIRKRSWFKNILFSGLLIGILINGYFLINYTHLVPVEVPSAEAPFNPSNELSMIIANVKMSNKNVQPLMDLISEKNPDLILAMETDQWWSNKLNVLTANYPYFQQSTNKVAYGMVLYSKLPLNMIDVTYLNNKKVPSFESTITLKNNQEISLHCLHPVPPTHYKDLPDNANQDENAMKKLGKHIQDRKHPTIVAGDLNDVVWSYVDELTNTKNILFDLRVGRGFFNSFSAENMFMRWPLDHVFVTEEFRLKKLERLSKIGSDHFPIYVELALKN